MAIPTDVARKTFEVNNNIQVIDPVDDIFLYPRDLESALEDQAPWNADPHYFQTVKISAIALIKMVTHARSGGIYEIMGVMYGRVRDRTFWITDVAALPVQGTETRVNAGNEAFEYMVQFQQANNAVGKSELLRGWYHSHPGYGCWLSGIDVNTQSNNQKYNDPYLAVVIDPSRTVSAGKVEIGAFRTYPEGKAPTSTSTMYQSIPMDKIEDFGVHANAYYPLKVEIYKTKLDEHLLDLLWNKYWVATLSQSLVVADSPYTTSQLNDLNAKLRAATDQLGDGSSTARLRLKTAPPTVEPSMKGSKGGKGKADGESAGVEEVETPLARAVKDGLYSYSARITNEARNGMISHIVKDKLFNTPLNVSVDPSVAQAAAVGRM